MRYWPNPAHKRETSEAGPPGWRPGKTKCPDDMTVAERNKLLETSIPADPSKPCSRRYNIRRGAHGLELYDFQCAPDENDEPVCHGYPTTFLPGPILRVLLADGKISQPEYSRLRKGQIP